MLIASTNRSSIDKLKIRLSSEFEMKDLGEAMMMLGMEIERDRVKGKMSLTRRHTCRRFYKNSILVIKPSL